MPTSARISVLMAVCNGGPYLAAALRSIAAQTMAEYEFVIINDGSTDGSAKVLDEAAAGDPRLRVFHQENQGLIASLNRGIALVQTPCIARMDGDDLALPQRFALELAHLDAHPECGAVGAQVLLVDSDGDALRLSANPLTHEEIDAAHLSGRRGAVMCHPSVMMRTSVVRQIGGYCSRHRHIEDLDLFLRMAEVTRLANLPDVLLHYRQHPTSVGYQHAAVQRRQAHLVAQEARARRGLPPLPPQAAPAEHRLARNLNRRWCRWAMQGGYCGTALKYARKELREHPLSPAAWWQMLRCRIRSSVRSQK